MQNTQFLSEIDIDTSFISTEDHGLQQLKKYMKTPRWFTGNRVVSRLRIPAAGALIAAAVVSAIASVGVFNPDTLVSVGSPTTPFSQNKQNEPALAVDASHPNVLVAVAHDNTDLG